MDSAHVAASLVLLPCLSPPILAFRLFSVWPLTRLASSPSGSNTVLAVPITARSTALRTCTAYNSEPPVERRRRSGLCRWTGLESRSMSVLMILFIGASGVGDASAIPHGSVPSLAGHIKGRILGLVLATLALNCVPAPAADIGRNPLPAVVRDTSFRNELQRAIDRGLAWLQANQNSNGWWSTPDHPALTALALMAFNGEPSGRYQRVEPDWLRRGYTYVAGCAQPDGGIHRSNLVTYNTAISMMALLAANKPEYDPLLRRARRFLVGLQVDLGEKGKIDTEFDGGVGYGSHYEHSDMGNTAAALEALYYSKRLMEDKALADARDLNWEAAISFLQNCQNLPRYNKQPWASDDAQNKGGFIYYPGHSMAGAETNAATGRVALRSYGSISYAGLLSYVYANLKQDDPRVLAVIGWLQKNYTLDENPGMGPEGLYYYFHTMAKALTVYGVSELDLQDGRKVNWRKELAMTLLNLQRTNGSWFNDNGRWWEKDPALVTAYAVLALEMVHRGL